jgi:hypothetical protein
MTAAERTPDATAGFNLAPADAEAMATRSSVSLMPSRLKRLQELDGSALREEWRRLSRSEPPRISRDLLVRALAYRVQELEFGGLPKWARQSLVGSAIDPSEAEGAPKPKPARPRLKPGARFMREWHGRTHSVAVLDDGFEFEGKRYRSLTQIAREITGAHWSGPRFFGLAKRKAEAELDSAPMGRDAPNDGGDFEPSGLRAPTIEARRNLDEVEPEDARCWGPLPMESAHG